MAKYSIDCINATPSRLQQYMDYAPFKEALSRCRTWSCPAARAIQWGCVTRSEPAQGHPDRQYLRSTEITVSCNTADLTNAGYVTVGRPFSTITRSLLTSSEILLPTALLASCIAAASALRAGLQPNLPEETAEAFVTYNGQRMYRSGDYANGTRTATSLSSADWIPGQAQRSAHRAWRDRRSYRRSGAYQEGRRHHPQIKRSG